MAQAWPQIAEHHLQQEGTYADFVEHLLAEEIKAKEGRTQTTLLKFAALPTIKTLEDYDFKFASGTPKTQINELSHLSFI